MLLIAKVTTSLSLSTGSVASAARRRYVGALVHRSHILWIDDLASKILIGIEMWEMERPFSMLTASCFTTCARTPFCLFSISWSVQTRAPDSGYSKPCKIWSRSVGRANCFLSSADSKYLGGGAKPWYGYLLSQKELTPTLTVCDQICGLLYISSSSGTSIIFKSLLAG